MVILPEYLACPISWFENCDYLMKWCKDNQSTFTCEKVKKNYLQF